ncbi:RICIN domain-containing protein [Yinghuangia seranimata]|uniref:RICIN domain-containing protein n=1 Tax=Yinghuangia seranimata TaxID=408067 RepID=UPI00248AE1D9|nr:RICIN domain-containing protein [Yinghuangia seranimata]MDI2131365.1 RICIN domain-containing protein [Yinghuangia seranimata]
MVVSRRIVIATLAATAFFGLLIGGVAGLLGGGGGGDGKKKNAAATASTSAGPPTSAPPPSAAPPSESPSASASKTSASPSASKPAGPAPGKVYAVVSGGGAMDVYGGEKADNTPVILYQPGAGKPNQQWTVQDAGGGFVNLVSRSANKCLDMRGGKDGHAVLDDCGRDGSQQWQAQPRGAGFVLVSRDGRTALGPGPQVRGATGLTLVPAGSGLVWSFTPAS